jgi:hypothetical protein
MGLSKANNTETPVSPMTVSASGFWLVKSEGERTIPPELATSHPLFSGLAAAAPLMRKIESAYH